MCENTFVKTLGIITYVLILIGALNWGLVGFFDFDLVLFLFSTSPLMVKLVYDIVGLSAIVSFVLAILCCINSRKCKMED